MGTVEDGFCVYLRELKEQLKYSAEFQKNENAWQEKHNMMLNMGPSKRGGGPERRQLGEGNKRAEERREKNQKEEGRMTEAANDTERGRKIPAKVCSPLSFLPPFFSLPPSKPHPHLTIFIPPSHLSPPLPLDLTHV